MNRLAQAAAVGNGRHPAADCPCVRCLNGGVNFAGGQSCEPYYLCTSGDDTVDVGNDLIPFLDVLKDAFCSLAGEDLAVWHVAPGGAGPRLVCVLRADGEGETVVRWLC